VTTTRLLPASAHREMPWKNGRGVTREVARADDPETGRQLWRLSIADIDEDAPFSPFPGLRRIISVLEGEGMALAVAGEPPREVRRFELYPFDGAARTDCRLLDGPVRDLNLMFDASRVSAHWEWLAPGTDTTVRGTTGRVLVFSTGEATVTVDAAPAIRLRRFDCIDLETTEPCELALTAEAGVRCAVIELTVP